jgi:hypothetical protein
MIEAWFGFHAAPQDKKMAPLLNAAMAVVGLNRR